MRPRPFWPTTLPASVNILSVAIICFARLEFCCLCCRIAVNMNRIFARDFGLRSSSWWWIGDGRTILPE